MFAKTQGAFNAFCAKYTPCLQKHIDVCANKVYILDKPIIWKGGHCMEITLNGSVSYLYSNIWQVSKGIGIYLIHDLSGVLYIGQTINIRRRYEEHLFNESNPLLRKAIIKPVGPLIFSWIETISLDEMERTLIQYLNPKCNRIKYHQQSKGVLS